MLDAYEDKTSILRSTSSQTPTRSPFLFLLLKPPCRAAIEISISGTPNLRHNSSSIDQDFTMSFGGQTPTIIVLKEGTDASQGRGQIVSNITACLAVQDTIRSTLGPYGGDLLLVDENGRQTITNDGATVMKV